MVAESQELRTSVKMRESTLKKLKKIGTMGDSYDDVVRQLIRMYNGKTIENKGKDPEYTRSM